jgi:hypothetical protein
MLGIARNHYMNLEASAGSMGSGFEATSGRRRRIT